MDPLLVEYTSHALLKADWKERITRAQAVCEEHGFSFGIQLHNTVQEKQIDQLWKMGIPFSVHAPILSEAMINLAMENDAPAWESLEHTAEWMRKIGADFAVFHGFIMTDKTILAFNEKRSYDECMREAFRPELSWKGLPYCSDFFSTEEFVMRRQWVKERLKKIRNKFLGLTFAIENDFPFYGSGLILGAHGSDLENPVCLDTGHLWASAHLFDRDFHQETRCLLASGNVAALHLHASKYTAAIPKENWRDGHQPLNIPNAMDLSRLIRMCREFGVRRFTLEISQASESDIRLFAQMWNEFLPAERIKRIRA